MTAPVLTPDATRCPQCAAELLAPGRCDTCGLRLTGPEADRLWAVDSELLRLDAARRPLLAERSSLLAALRGTPASAPLLEPVALPRRSSAPLAPRAEWTPQRTSNALLGLGGLLLAVAAVVFTAVTYDRLGAGGRALVLLALTAAAALAVPRLLRRGLRSTAESVTAVALVLTALDAYGLRTLGLADATDPLPYAAASSGVLAVLSAGYATRVPVRLARVAAVALAQLPVLLLLLHAPPSPAAVALVLTALAAADLVAVALLSRRRWARPEVVAVAAVSAALLTAVALLCAAVTALQDQPGAGAAALLCVAVVLGAGAALTRDDVLRAVLSALPVGVVALAAHALARPGLAEVQAPLVPAAVAVVVATSAALLPRGLRVGPVLGAAAVAAAAAAAVAEQALLGLLGPLGWLREPWTLSAGATARQALAPGASWDGALVTPVVLAAAAVVALGGGLALHRLRVAAAPAAALAVGTAVLLPLGLNLPHAVGLGLLLALGAAALLAPRHAEVDLPAFSAGTALVLLAAAWSLADRSTTLAVLPAAAALLAATAWRGSRQRVVAPAAGLAGLLGAGSFAAAAAAGGWAADQVGGLLTVAVAALVALADPRCGAARRSGLETAAGLTAAAAVLLASSDAGWLSWTLAGLAGLALAGALRPDRRRLALAGGLLLSASSWVRLADAGVGAPEPYVLPLALAALALGHLRRRAEPQTGSFAAYGAGLSALLLPSLVASYAGSPLWRPLLLAGVALGVVLLGARGRLQAPLVLGGAVLAADALLLLAPYASALPRWLALGAAGALLIGVGATYEQRLRDLVRLRDRYDALA